MESTLELVSGRRLGSGDLNFAGGVAVAYNGSWCSQARTVSWNTDWRFKCAVRVVVMQDDQVYTQLNSQAPVLVARVEMARTEQAYLLHKFYTAVTAGHARLPPARITFIR